MNDLVRVLIEMDNETAPAVRCNDCGQVVGTYEAMLVLSPLGDLREISPAQADELHGEDEHYHPSCYLRQAVAPS